MGPRLLTTKNRSVCADLVKENIGPSLRSFLGSADDKKGRVVCETVYGDMHLKDLLGSIVKVEYGIPVPDFYLVLHGICCRKSTIMD